MSAAGEGDCSLMIPSKGVEELRPLTSLGVVVVEEHVCVARVHEVHRVPIKYGNCFFVHESAHTQ
jgi:hypothetical protein